MIQRAITATNASKAVIAIVLSQAIEFSEAFGLYEFSLRQEKAIEGAVMGAFFLYVLATYKLSRKRRDDGASEITV